MTITPLEALPMVARLGKRHRDEAVCLTLKNRQAEKFWYDSFSLVSYTQV
jgi:hypothetical protein